MGCWCARRTRRHHGEHDRPAPSPSHVEALARRLEALEREAAGIRTELELLATRPEHA